MHARELDGRTLTLLVSGKLWRNSLIMQDEETGTLWSHVTGEALDGELTGRRLEIVPGVHTTWAEWQEAQPKTLVSGCGAFPSPMTTRASSSHRSRT